MIILITGTPGVGKTTVSKILAEKIGAHIIHINELVNEKNIYTGIDEEKGYKIVNLDALFNELDEITEKIDKSRCIIVEGHLSHLFEKSDIVMVLRANPHVLRDRMMSKGWKESKICENIEAEIIDLCSYESFEIHENKVNEIDTSDISPQKVADSIIGVVNGSKKFPVGNVDFLDYLNGI
ncbi:MAG: adenylate kinase family protein [Methanobacterium sp.]|uniref:adenylate kinase family protein n=1 Tax=Methanobacterium sp. TaxID=2164 RepID=UPI003D64CF54|nr:adenylate kinase family protein [Methanobacterium sp.]